MMRIIKVVCGLIGTVLIQNNLLLKLYLEMQNNKMEEYNITKEIKNKNKH